MTKPRKVSFEPAIRNTQKGDQHPFVSTIKLSEQPSEKRRRSTGPPHTSSSLLNSLLASYCLFFSCKEKRLQALGCLFRIQLVDFVSKHRGSYNKLVRAWTVLPRMVPRSSESVLASAEQTGTIVTMVSRSSYPKDQLKNWNE